MPGIAGMNTPVTKRSAEITRRSNGGGSVSRDPGTGASPVFTARTPPDGTHDVAYSYQYAATGSPAPIFEVVAGSLPTGLTLTSAGLLAGTPTVAATYNFTVRARNSFYPAVDAAESVVIA